MRLFSHGTLLRQHSANKDNIVLEFFHPDNPGCLRELLAYCINEFGAENVLALIACRDYAKAPTWAKLRYINATFVELGSPFEVNYDTHVRQSLRLQSTFNLGALQYKVSGSRRAIKPVQAAALPPDPNYFKTAKLQDAIEDNLSDTFSRFSISTANFQEKLKQIWVGRIAVDPGKSEGRKQVLNALVDMRNIAFHFPRNLTEL
jgi:hypothetical protein